MGAAELQDINERIAALFNPAELSEGEPGDFDGPLFETMRERQDDELASLEALRAEIEAKRKAELLAILDATPLPPTFATRAQRRTMQAGVDALIDYLDAVTPDADREDGADDEPFMSRPETGTGHQRDTSFGGDECEPDGDGEPSLAATIYGTLYQNLWSRGSHQDLEEQNEDGDPLDDGEEDRTDWEPSLGAPEHDMHFRRGWGGLVDRKCDQSRWADGGCGDRERDDGEGEPSLGWPEQHHNQGHAGRVGGLVSEKGDFDELRPPGAGSAAWYEVRRAARADAEGLLNRHGLGSFRSDNLVPIAPGMMLLTRVA